MSDLSVIAILMGTYNGEKYIAVQLDSIAAQTHQNWRLIVSDDGSTDGTLDVVRQYQALWGAGKIEIRQGPRKGFAHNFLSMACDPSIKADYYAFCDQDDVWLPQKLVQAISYHETVKKPEIAHVYCGRTAYVRDDLKPYMYSPEFVFPRTFRNALIQSIAGGNTMVFNRPTKCMLEAIGIVPTPSHDWWLYQIVTGSGGVVYYDSIPNILYRQHPDALVGGNASFLSGLKRLKMIFEGRFKEYSDKNIECLERGIEYLDDSSREILDIFKRMRTAKLKDRIRLLEVCGLYRQTWRGTMSFIITAALKKI